MTIDRQLRAWIATENPRTSRIMSLVLLALVPGAAVMIWHWGLGVLVNLLTGMSASVLFEATILSLRKRPVLPVLGDGSALVTGALIGLSLPPDLPVWMVGVGCFFAVVIAKQLYGGLGHNVFNPAMVGYAVLIISFPLAMSSWPDMPPAAHSFDERMIDEKVIDGQTGATPLDAFRNKGALTHDEFKREEGMQFRLTQWREINLAFLTGGLLLIWLRLSRWRAPLAMIVSLFLCSALSYDGGSSVGLGPTDMHLFAGATMMAAFFIVTDPVTSPVTEKGQWIFGAGVGVLVFLIRSLGAFPDGVAFAILLMNGFTPLINLWMDPP